MSGGFDPYHKWLGIPAHEQPANYYRLLGLELFEEDLDAIESAADRLIKYVRGTATVEQRRHAREILDELSAAKRCLLIAGQKQAYDAGFRAGRATTQNSKRTQPPGKSETPAAVQVTPIAAKPRAPSHRQPNSWPAPRRVIAIVLACALIGLAGLGFLYLRGDLERSNQVATNDSAEQTVRAAIGTTSEPEVKTVNLETDEPADASSLPEFASQVPESDQPSNNEATNPEPIEKESSLAIESESLSEPEVTEDALPDSQLPANEKITGIAERGGLLREVWTNVTGSKVEEFVQYVAEHPEPNQTVTVDRFESPEDYGDQYGQRLSGYLHPPVTGSYEFSIRANAEARLSLSTDALPENKRGVEPGTKIDFEAGRAYYVEVFHKESTGRDYLSIGWKLPDAVEEKPIPSERLSVHYRIAPRHETEFVVLAPLSAESSSGITLDLIGDGVIAAMGNSNNDETYQLKFESEMETITALLLEAIPHASLPASGPGRGLGGRFGLAELSVIAASRAAPEPPKSLSFVSAVDDAGHDLRRIVDGDEKTVWRVSGRGKQAAVTLAVRDPGSFAGGVSIQVELKQREPLGCFRLLATSAPDPRSALRPSGGIGGDQTLYSLLVNLGGDDFTAPDGVRWQASTFFDNETFGHEGGRGVSEDLIANKVQGSAQRGIAAFRAVVPEGTYEVTLYFCEYWSTTPSSRRFAIAAEQRVVTANLDLFQAAGGFARPFVYPIRNVKVTDGRLDIDFRAASEGASTLLNAIRIQQVR